MERKMEGEIKRTARAQLIEISKTLETLAQQFKTLANLMDEGSASTAQKKKEPPLREDPAHIIEKLKLKTISREEAERLLEGLKHEELGNIFSTIGPSRDRKKPKKWLIDQILWHYYDFETGHRILRGDRELER
ncbi:hypothetical protein G7K71_02660 [Desulfofundulus sp. TPOSR]|uniref:hypothetical protein n=1 Tax=Desulfofundulus sp. TPOSR TaxID=2714340 RepID=UPI00140A1D83|nr:hypothetical protein [Desulfofundulus sp. TPOSR]NHM25927.1 hypothetical protein [Desulfofundulus sp. TPOSR]